jgi:hypothetical protein
MNRGSCFNVHCFNIQRADKLSWVWFDGGTVMMKPENLIAFDGARKLVGL